VLDLAAYQRDGEAFRGALGRERYLHGAGLQPTLELCPLYEDFAHLFRQDTFGELLEAECEPKPKRHLLDFAATGHLEDRARVLTEQLASEEASATVVWDEQPLPYHLVPVALANEPDARRRHELDARWREAMARLNPLREERHRTLLEATPGLEHSDYVALYDELRDLHLADLTEAAKRFLAATERAYFDALEELLGIIGLALADAAVCDLAWLFRARQLDDYFGPKSLLPALYRSVRDLGLEVQEPNNVARDVEARPGKRPGAFCARLALPQDVRVVLQPAGGRLDYAALFQQMGRALCYGNVDRTLAFAYRWLGDQSVGWSYGQLLESLLLEPGWLEPRLDLERPADYLRLAHFERLYAARRDATGILYAQRRYRTDNGDALASYYVESHTRYLGVEHAPEPFLSENDDGLCAALRFRATIFAVQQRQYLRREYDEEWYRLPRAGRFLRDLWREGQKYAVDELARFMGYAGLDLRPLTDELRDAVK
jgi:hypothetical protein